MGEFLRGPESDQRGACFGNAARGYWCLCGGEDGGKLLEIGNGGYQNSVSGLRCGGEIQSEFLKGQRRIVFEHEMAGGLCFIACAESEVPDRRKICGPILPWFLGKELLR